jgi:hypothetical protein
VLDRSAAWEMLAQAAQAAKNTELLELTSDCHPETLRQVRWANTMIKNLSPQILTSVRLTNPLRERDRVG